MTKNRSIMLILHQLQARLGPDAFEVMDHWDADMCAIGISSPHDPTRLVYISSFHREFGRYDVETEMPRAEFRDVDAEKAIEIIEGHVRAANAGAEQ